MYGRQVLPWDEAGLDFGLDLNAARRMATNQVIPWRRGPVAPEQFLVEPRQWATFPMKTEGQTVGVLGAALPPRGFTEQEHRQFKLVTSLVAQSPPEQQHHPTGKRGNF